MSRERYAHFQVITTRWKDNDVYGHVNNVEYYSYFDTVINTFLIRQGGLDIHRGASIGLCVESHCRFDAPIEFPDAVHAGLRVSKLGNSSVRYEIALYRNDDPLPCAAGHFVHVYVERSSQRAVPIPAPVRALLETLCGAAAAP